MRDQLSLLLVVLLLGPGAAVAQDVAEPALAPLNVALRDLPGIIALALNESAYQLLSDQAQAQLAVELEYVRGFSDLPAGEAALQDQDLRQAYAWLERVVETAAAIPSTFDDSQRAGATCRAHMAGVPAADPEGTVRLGLDAIDRLAVLRGELEFLVDEAPSLLDVAPLREAVALIEGYWIEVVPEIQACLEQLLDELEAEGALSGTDGNSIGTDGKRGSRTVIKAILVPTKSYPTGHVRVIGSAPSGSTVRVTSASLDVDGSPGLVKGSFRLPFTVPRDAFLGNHALTVAAAGAQLQLSLPVGKAPVFLDLQAPGRVLANSTFTATVKVTSPVSLDDVDTVPVRLTWRGAQSSLALQDGVATKALATGAPQRLVLEATFAGSGLLAAARDNVTIDVVEARDLPSTNVERTTRGLFTAPATIDWFWWILMAVLAVLFAMALYYSPVVLHRVRGQSSQVVRGRRPPPRWPGARTFAAAIGALFAMLRRAELIAPGRTVQEWMRKMRAPAGLADQFDAVEYGGLPEPADATVQGVHWVRAAWERWKR